MQESRRKDIEELQPLYAKNVRLECYQLSMDDISDRLIEKKHEEDDLGKRF
jgi:hypothetical protein